MVELSFSQKVALIFEYSSLCYYIMANQYKGEGLTLQKLVQVGVQGLEQAIKTYDTSSEQPLLKFAVPMMRDVIESFIRVRWASTW